jgi:hypothetical protein
MDYQQPSILIDEGSTTIMYTQVSGNGGYPY